VWRGRGDFERRDFDWESRMSDAHSDATWRVSRTPSSQRKSVYAVIPANAGIHFDFAVLPKRMRLAEAKSASP